MELSYRGSRKRPETVPANIAAIYLANRASRNQQFDFPLPTTGYVD